MANNKVNEQEANVTPEQKKEEAQLNKKAVAVYNKVLLEKIT